MTGILCDIRVQKLLIFNYSEVSDNNHWLNEVELFFCLYPLPRHLPGGRPGMRIPQKKQPQRGGQATMKMVFQAMAPRFSTF
jgi:hypothetical protein